MSLDGFDIASHQAGMDAGKAAGDFAIVKATQGVSYTNPCFSRHYAQAAAAGKLLGAYHYASGGDPAKEADYFLTVVRHRIKSCILCLDWEHNKGGGENYVFGTPSEVEWCRKFAQRVHDKTGIWPLIYMSASVTRRRNWQPVAEHCPLWVAQYASNTRTGYQSKPWTDGRGYGAWQAPAIFQYSSHGRIGGWDKDIDINIAYLTRDEWMALAGGGKTMPEKLETVYPEKSDSDLAVEVMFQKHGYADERRKKLGGRYNRVQEAVDSFFLDMKGMTNYQTALTAYLKKWGHTGLV